MALPDINQRHRGVWTRSIIITKNLKAGVGYIFTDFSDELIDLKYNHRGIFVNLIGAK